MADEIKNKEEVQEDLEFDIAEELAKLEPEKTEENTGDESDSKDIHVRIPGKVKRVNRAKSAFKLGVRPEQQGTRWMRLIILVAITLAVVVWLFYSNLQRKQKPLKESLTQALHLSPDAAYEFLVSEAMFWDCDPASIQMKIHNAPPQIKQSHIYSVSVLCSSKVLWYNFRQNITAEKPIQLPPEAFHHSFFYQPSEKMFVSDDLSLKLDLDEKGEHATIVKKD